MWKRKTIRKANQMDEVNWSLPPNQQDGNNLASWAPTFQDSFEGPSGGPDIHGPSNGMLEICRTSSCIGSIFFSLFPVSLFNYIAEMSQIYAFKDWVAHVTVKDRDGNNSKRTRLRPCKNNDPNKRHRAGKVTVNFTAGYVICWIGILIYYGSLGSTKSPQNFWKKMPYGIYAPWVQNTMTRDALMNTEG